MQTTFPVADGLSGAFLLGPRRRPGLPSGPGSVEQVVAVIVKRAYTVTAAGLVPDPAGPVIFEADQPLGDESDLVAYKPRGDLVVIAAAPPEPLSVAVNGVVRMQQPGPPPPPVLTGLAWEPRTGAARLAEGGDFLAMTQALPDAFENTFYNGHRRNAVVGGPVRYLQPGDQVVIERAGSVRTAFTVPAAVPQLRHDWYVGQGVDDPALWRRRTQAFDLDTLVVHFAPAVAYLVWRAVWPVTLDPDGHGPIPFDANRRITVTLEGA